MGFLHKLWDETLAGPAPEDGLGKLRKYNSFSATRSPAFPNTPSDHHGITTTPISRSITILRANSTNLRNVNNASSSESPYSLPSSPSGSITPDSPLSPSTPRVNKKLARRKSTAEAIQCDESRSPTGYDWIVLSALDR
ncbi:hypothetical protein LguiA_010079 [Lonicera macranthoides]